MVMIVLQYNDYPRTHQLPVIMTETPVSHRLRPSCSEVRLLSIPVVHPFLPLPIYDDQALQTLSIMGA